MEKHAVAAVLDQHRRYTDEVAAELRSDIHRLGCDIAKRECRRRHHKAICHIIVVTIAAAFGASFEMAFWGVAISGGAASALVELVDWVLFL